MNDKQRAKELAEILLYYRGGLENRAAHTAYYLFGQEKRYANLLRVVLKQLGHPNWPEE